MSENMTPETGNVIPETPNTETGFGETESSKPQPSYYQYNPQNHTYVEPEQPKGSGLAIAGMVCGIVALVIVCCFWPFGIVLGIAGLILSIISLNKKQSKGMSVAGIVTSGLGILLGAALGILSVVFLTAVNEAYENPTYQEFLEYGLYYDSYDEYYDYEYNEKEDFLFEDHRAL